MRWLIRVAAQAKAEEEEAASVPEWQNTEFEDYGPG
jgi:hypothetical protein